MAPTAISVPESPSSGTCEYLEDGSISFSAKNWQGSSDTKSFELLSRPTHGDMRSAYCLPADEDERVRLNQQHVMIRDYICNGKLIFDDSVQLNQGDIVLDLGTGSGAWASDIAARVPAGVKVQGFDISGRLFPCNTPELSFHVGNVLDLPKLLRGKVSLAHQRLLLYGLRCHEWKQALTSIMETLVPGRGIIQLTEVLTPPSNPGIAQEQFHDLLLSLAYQNNLLVDCATYLSTLLAQLSFVDIKESVVKVRLGRSGNEQGIFAASCRIGAFRGMRDTVMRDGGYGIVRTPEEFDQLLNRVEDEWESNECYAYYYSVTARAPS